MCVRYLGFILLIWFPGALHAQSAAQSCSAPRLDGGFFAPKQQTYSDGTKLSYTCVEGRKPAVKGWWATSTCHSGKWSPEPQCIDEKACLPPDIPNAKYIENRSGWYRDGHKIRITCDEGYEPKYRHVTAKCNGGTWTSLPVCEKSINACGEPPKIPHAVIIHQEYQEVFAANSEVQYECEDGYTVEGTDTTKSIFCIYGNWTEGPTCKSSSTSGSNERTSRPQITTVDHCGAYPNVPNGDVVERDQTYIKFQCNAFYTQVGLGTVVCYSDGTWSQLPICKEAFCVLDPAEHVGANFRLSGVEYLKEGEEKHIACIQQDYSSRVQCTNGKIHFTQCRETEPAAAKGGSATAGGNTTSAGSRTRPAGGGSSSTSGSNDRRPQFIPVDNCGAPPNVSNAEVKKYRMFLKYQCNAFHTLVGLDTVACHSNRTWSPLPVCKGSSTTSGSTDRDSGPAFRPVDDCGAYPNVPNGDVVQKDRMFLKYQCEAFHTLVGEATVACHSDRTWSPLPLCKEAHCTLDPAQYAGHSIQVSGAKFLKEGEQKHFPCVWRDYSSHFQCTNGRITFTRCCRTYEHQRGLCR